MKKIILPKQDVKKLFQFLEENEVDEYNHYIKITEDESQKGKYNYSLSIKKEKFNWWWFGTLLVGIYFFSKIIQDGWGRTILNNYDNWIGPFLVFGMIGVLICFHFLFKEIYKFYKNKVVRVDEDKVNRKPRYYSNIEIEK